MTNSTHKIMLLCYFVTDGNLKICYKNQTLSTRYLLGIYSVSTLLLVERLSIQKL